jgi:hypothetical protein
MSPAEPLPQTLAECHELIRDLSPVDEEPLQQAGALVGKRLGLSPQQGALMLILARAKRPLSRAQLDERLPERWMDHERGMFAIRVIVWNVRKRLGDAAILSEGRQSGPYPGSYWLPPEMVARVREAAA